MSGRRKFTLRIHDARGGYTQQLARDAVDVATLAAVALDDPNVIKIEIERR